MVTFIVRRQTEVEAPFEGENKKEQKPFHFYNEVDFSEINRV